MAKAPGTGSAGGQQETRDGPHLRPSFLLSERPPVASGDGRDAGCQAATPPGSGQQVFRRSASRRGSDRAVTLTRRLTLGLGGPSTMPPEPGDMRAGDGAFDRADRIHTRQAACPGILRMPHRANAGYRRCITASDPWSLGRELLLPGRLDVLDLVHGLAQARELPVHLLSRSVGVPQGFVFREAVPRVVAKDVRERELLV